MKPIKTDMQSVLARHIGKNNGITAKLLAGTLACSERDVRTLITDLRLDGVAVCGTPSTGYYIAATHEDMGDLPAGTRDNKKSERSLSSGCR